MKPADVPTEIRDGRYALLELLGVGGMASVYRARDQELQVDRAIKMLRPEDADRASFQRRLRAEAHAMARVQHPHILTIHDVGTEGEYFYVVMPLASGGSLAERLETRGPLPVGEAVRFTLEVLSGLSAAHAQGVIHRDVKPQNVLIDGREHALLADFGIALDTQGQSDRRTRSGVAMGSPSYMPPEQRVDARSVDHRADLYAVGAMLFELLTNLNPADLYTANPGSPRWGSVPEELVSVLRKATAMQREDRYASAEEFTEALLAAAAAAPWLGMLESPTNARSLAGRPVGGRSLGFGDTSSGGGAALSREDAGLSRVVMASILSGLALFVVGTLAVLGAVGVAVFSPRGEAPVPPAASVEVADIGSAEPTPVAQGVVAGPSDDVVTKPSDEQPGIFEEAAALATTSEPQAPPSEASNDTSPPSSPEAAVPAEQAVSSLPSKTGEPSRGSSAAPQSGSTKTDSVAAEVSTERSASDATPQSSSGPSEPSDVQNVKRPIPVGTWVQSGAGAALRLSISGGARAPEVVATESSGEESRSRRLAGKWDEVAGSFELSDVAGTEEGGHWNLSLSDDGEKLSGTFRSFEGKTRLLSFRAAP